MCRIVVIVATVLTAVIASNASAQDAPPTEKKLKATGDISFVKTGGNTDVSTLGLSDKIEWKTSDRFTIKQNFGWVYGTDEGVANANALLTGVRGEYFLTERFLMFLGLNYDFNMFSGVKRRFEEYLGVGVDAIKTDRDILRLEGGFSLFQEWQLYADTSYSFTAGRAAADFKHYFAEKAYFQQVVEFLPNFKVSDDYRLNTETSLVAPIGGNFAIKVAYIMRYRGLPPEGVSDTDTVFRTAIQITN
jgi:putative salt-induced outer membrane protein YdiY